MFQITELKFKFGGLQGKTRNKKNIMFLRLVFVWSSGNGFMKTTMCLISECII
jgi:hypothetical protein